MRPFHNYNYYVVCVCSCVSPASRDGTVAIHSPALGVGPGILVLQVNEKFFELKRDIQGL